MKNALSKSRIQSDILEWSLPKEVLSVLLKDCTAGLGSELGDRSTY
jgi:hypothetical protein